MQLVRGDGAGLSIGVGSDDILTGSLGVLKSELIGIKKYTTLWQSTEGTHRADFILADAVGKVLRIEFLAYKPNVKGIVEAAVLTNDRNVCDFPIVIAQNYVTDKDARIDSLFVGVSNNNITFVAGQGAASSIFEGLIYRVELVTTI